MTCSPSLGWLCRSTPCASFPPRMRSQLQGSDLYPGGSTSHWIHQPSPGHTVRLLPSKPMVVMQPQCTVEGADIVMQSSERPLFQSLPPSLGVLKALATGTNPCCLPRALPLAEVVKQIRPRKNEQGAISGAPQNGHAAANTAVPRWQPDPQKDHSARYFKMDQ